MLAVLADAQGKILSKRDLLNRVWPDTSVSDDSLYQAVAEIRRGLGEDGAKILVNRSRRGYALIPCEAIAQVVLRPSRKWWAVPVAACLVLVAMIAFKVAETSEKLGIVVHPFQIVASSERLTLFGESMAGEIASAIAENGWLQIYDEESAGNARFSMTGLVQEVGGRVHIQTRLVESASRRIVWSKSWNGEVENFLDFQMAVATEAAAELGGHWSGAVVRTDAMAAAARPTESLDAYELFLRGTQAKHRFTEEGYEEAQDLLHRSLAIDPRFAKAWTTLSVVESLRVDFVTNATELEEIIAARSNAVTKAFELAPEDPATLMEYSWLLARRGDRAAAKEGYRRAVALAPQNADVLAYAAIASNMTGAMGEEGVEWVARARRLNPAPPPWYLIAEGQAYFGNEDWEQAIRAFQESPNPVPKHLYSMAAWHALGDPERAQAEADALEAVAPDFRLDYAVYFDGMDMAGNGGRLVEAGLTYGVATGDLLSALRVVPN